MNNLNRELFDQMRPLLVDENDPHNRMLDDVLSELIAHAPRRVLRMMEMAQEFALRAIVDEEPRLMYASIAVMTYAGIMPIRDSEDMRKVLDVADQAYQQGRDAFAQVIEKNIADLFG